MRKIVAGIEPPTPVVKRERLRDALGLLQCMSFARELPLSTAQVGTLLGVSEATVRRWNRSAVTRSLRLRRDTQERISYVLGIVRALAILFPTPANRGHWLRNANNAYPFNGQTPLERMLAGHVADLHMVRTYLDAAIG